MKTKLPAEMAGRRPARFKEFYHSNSSYLDLFSLENLLELSPSWELVRPSLTSYQKSSQTTKKKATTLDSSTNTEDWPGQIFDDV